MKRILAIVLAAVLTASAGAQALGVDDAVAQALKVNTSYLGAQLAADRAQAALSPLVNWKGISVSATQKQTSETALEPAASTTTWGLNLPLFDQLGASATVDQDQNAQVSVTASPLAHSDTAAQARITYEKALIAAAQARTALETSVRKAYWAQATAQAQASLAAKKSALLETSYSDAKARYDKGSVTLAEVRTALQDWIEARTDQTSLERAAVKARSDLSTLLQGDAEVVFDLEAVEAAVKALGTADTTVTGTSSAVRVQALEVESQQAKADAVWLLDPSLAVSANALIPASGDATWSASVTLTLSLGDWQGSDKSLAQRSALLAAQTLAAEKTAARAAQTQAVLAVQAAGDTVETRTLALAQARELLTETSLLVKAGEATALELEDSQLGVTSAEIDLYTAWADLYGARLDLKTSQS